MTVPSAPPGDSPAAPASRKPSLDLLVFGVSAALSAAFVVWGVLNNKSLKSVAQGALDWVIQGFGWFFVLTAAGFVLLSALLAFSRYGKIRLGKDDDKPEFRTVSWIAMMFSAGMGIGLMFYGVAEPISHLGSPPMGLAEPGTPEAGRLAMEYSYFHWAVHPWAMYAVVGLALAYFTFRKGRPNLISSAFFPLIGRRSEGGTGRAIDILAIFATLFGSATSLGLGALQINSGLNQLWEVPQSNALAFGIIIALTAAFVVSAVSGVRRGIQWLSNTNMVLAVLLLAFLFVVGPTVFILNTFTESLGGYLTGLPGMSFRTAAFGGSDWLSGWTIFYWAWWISWTPFVGTFIARISKGRTIRQFVVGVILVPSIVSFVWFSVLGGTAIHLQTNKQADIIAANEEGLEAALFATLKEFPLFAVMAVLVIILVSLFFVSGADAASVVLGMLSSKGVLQPGRLVIIFWGVLTGLVAGLLLYTGGLGALQTLTILAAAPFLLVICGMCAGLIRDLAKDPAVLAPPDDGPQPSPDGQLPMKEAVPELVK